MKLTFPWGKKIHALLDVRSDMLAVEFVEVHAHGEWKTLTRLSVPLSHTIGNVAHAVRIVTEVKSLLSRMPQYQPRSVLVFLHTPLTQRVQHAVKEAVSGGVVTQEQLTALREHAPKDARPNEVMVHEYVAEYRVNNYRVHQALRKQGKEVSVTLVRTYVSKDLYTALLAPLEAVFAAPLHAVSFTEAFVRMIVDDTHAPRDFRLCDVAADHIEVTTVLDGQVVENGIETFGVRAAREVVAQMSNMSLADVATSLPLLAKNALDQARAEQLAQGIVMAADKIAALVNRSGEKIHRTLPVLISFPEADASFGEIVATKMPYTRLTPAGDMPHMASVLGL